MIPEKSICIKFPAVLRKKLLALEITLPDETQFIYDPFTCFRAVRRKKNDYTPVSREDFRSQYETGHVPNRLRGMNLDNREKEPRFYGTLLSTNKAKVEQQMRMPSPRLKMAVGTVYMEGGPQLTEDEHVCWWLFEDADVSGFVIGEG